MSLTAKVLDTIGDMLRNTGRIQQGYASTIDSMLDLLLKKVRFDSNP